MAQVFDKVEDDVRSVVEDLDAVSLQTRKYLGCPTVGCSYGSVVVGECMVSPDIPRLVAAKRVTLAVETAL